MWRDFWPRGCGISYSGISDKLFLPRLLEHSLYRLAGLARLSRQGPQDPCISVPRCAHRAPWTIVENATHRLVSPGSIDGSADRDSILQCEEAALERMETFIFNRVCIRRSCRDAKLWATRESRHHRASHCWTRWSRILLTHPIEYGGILRAEIRCTVSRQPCFCSCKRNW